MTVMHAIVQCGCRPETKRAAETSHSHHHSLASAALPKTGMSAKVYDAIYFPSAMLPYASREGLACLETGNGL